MAAILENIANKPFTIEAMVQDGIARRHGVLLMQSPDDPVILHLGDWGSARDSAEWEEAMPQPPHLLRRPTLFSPVE